VNIQTRQSDMKTRKTRQEKIAHSYKLGTFVLQADAISMRRDVQEFGYLDSTYVIQDLLRTLLYTVIIVTLLVVARIYFSG